LFLRDEAAARKDLETAVAMAPTPLPPKAAVLKAALEKRDPKELLASYPSAGPVLVAAYGRFDPEADRAKIQEALDGPEVDIELLLLGANTAFFGAQDLERATTLADRGGALAPWSVEFAGLRAQIALAKKDCVEAELRVAQAATLMSEHPRSADLEQIAKLRERVASCKTK